MIDYTKINSETWNSWAEDGFVYTLPISHEEYEKTTADNFVVRLTPCITVPHEWFGELKGKKILGLASGGGQQMPVLSKLGAECTVFDYSDKQLEADRMVSEREGYNIEIIKGDMSKPLPFENESFDVIINRHGDFNATELYRLLKRGGIFITEQVGGDNDRDLVEMVLPNTEKPFPHLNLKEQKKVFEDAGFDIVEQAEAFRPIKFYDVGAFVWFARIIEWEFPEFSVDKCFEHLLEMQKKIDEKGCVEGTIHRYLIVAKNRFPYAYYSKMQKRQYRSLA